MPQFAFTFLHSLQEKMSRQRMISAVLLLAVFLSVPSPAPGQTEAEGNVLRATLKNGLRVVIIKNALAPVVTTQVNYLVGGNEDPPGLSGMAHAQEHMMFRGSKGLSADQLSAIIAALGGNFNADTQQTVTQYFFTIPAEDLDVALRIEATRMRNVLDTQKLWERERGAIEQEVAQDLSNPMYVFYTKLVSEMFRGTPYAHTPLGTSRSFNTMTGPMLAKFHRTWYAPNNAVLVIAGDIDPGKTLALARRLFGAIPRRPVPRRPAVLLKPLKAKTISLETDLPYGVAVVAYRLPGFASPDYAAGQILADMLGSKRGNLYALAPEGRALSADFSLDPNPDGAIGYAEAAFAQGEDGSLLVSKLKDVIADYLKNGFPAELVEAAKRLEIADDEFQKNSVEGLASLWSQALAVEGRGSPKEDTDAIRKVTLRDVNRVARKYLVNDTALTAVLTPRPGAGAVSSKRAPGRESFAPKQTKHVRLPAWARKAALLPGLPAPAGKPEVFSLPNGLRLIVRSEQVSGTVSVFGKVKNNPYLEVPKGKEGVDQVLDDLFSYGTTTYDRLGFQKALDDIAARESAGTSFSLQVLTEHFDRGAQLLADNLLHPALPGDAFRVVQRETAGALSGLLKSPSYLARRALVRALFPPNDPALRQATQETVAKLTLEDVKEYYRHIFRPDMTTIVVVGQVTPEQAKSVIGKYFGGWKAEGPKPETDLPPVPPNEPSSADVPDASRVQDEVRLAETVALTRSHPDYYTLQVGRHVLSGAFYATRLFRDLREKTGLVYTVEAFLDVGKTRSLFAVIYACDPGNVAKARGIVERDLREMQTTQITMEELDQARTLMLRQIPLTEASTDSIAEKLLRLSLEDLPLDEPVRAAKRYREITASEVRAAFEKWIRPSEFVQVTLGPNPR
ncbi:MAG: insulinase family protein [Nitrospirae bacterium]|nr:insulinase family protein [Nitrospirota bacterium]